MYSTYALPNLIEVCYVVSDVKRSEGQILRPHYILIQRI